jgi:hypothetical protein
MAKLLCLPLLAAIQFQITGCYGDEYEYMGTHYEVLGGGGLMSDTTAIISILVTDHYDYQGHFGAGGNTKVELREFSLNLVDIRFEKIYWKKIIIADISHFFYGSLYVDAIDSSLFFYKIDCITSSYYKKDCRIDRITVVSMDEKFWQPGMIELKYKYMELRGEGWEYHDVPPPIRPWKDGLLLTRQAGKASPYALLDTVAGTMELWRPSGEFEWLNECRDYKWSRAGGLCLKEMPDTLGFVLLRNGVDTLAVRYKSDDNWPYLYFNGNSIVSGGFRYLISEQGQVSEEILNVRGMGIFRDLDGNLLVSYDKTIRK